MPILNRFLHLRKKSGIVLFLIRLPERAITAFLRKLSTLFWRLFLSSVGNNVIIEWGVYFDLPKNVVIGNNVYIGKNTRFGSEYLNGKIKICDDVQISQNCKIDHTGDIIIHKGVNLSEDVTLFSHSHGYNPRSKPTRIALSIGENCWIGYKSIILEKTMYINSGVIVASGSVVSKPCDIDDAIYGGVPAKLIKRKNA